MMLGTPTPRRYIRRGLLAFSTIALIGLVLLFGPLIWSAPNAQSHLPRSQRAMAQAGTELDTTADQVYGQANFSSAAAPNPPNNASLNGPAHMMVYISGQVFVADTGNNRVLIWDDLNTYENGDPASMVLGQPGFTSTTAPNPPTASSLNSPSAVDWDDNGNLYVSDTGNNRVLMFTPTSIDSDEFLNFTDGQAASLVIGQSNFTSNAAPNPPTAGSLNHPVGIVLDYYDNLVVADRDNNRVLFFEGPLSTGMIATKVIGHPRDVVGAPFATYGDFFTNTLSITPTETSLNHPTGVAIGAAHDELYVADTGNNRVLVYTASPIDSIADVVIGQPDFGSKTPNANGLSASSLNNPTGIAVDAGDRLLVVDTGNHRVLEYDNPNTSPIANRVFGQGGSFTTNTANTGGLSADSLNAPVGVSTDDDWLDIYIADQGNHRVLEYDQPLVNAVPKVSELYPGTVRAGSASFDLEIWGTGIISGTTIQMNGVTRSEAGTESSDFIAVTLSATEIATPGIITVTLTNPLPGGGTSQPMTLTVYAPLPGDTTADSIMGQAGFTSDAGAFEWVTADSLLGPTSVAIDHTTGRAFVADMQNWRVLSWPSQAALKDGQKADLVIGQPNFGEQDWKNPIVTASSLLYPTAIAVDQSGNLYVADTPNHRVLIYHAPLSNGVAASVVIGQPNFVSNTYLVSPTAASLAYPQSVAVDSNGNLYVADTSNNRVLEFDAPLSTNMAASRVFGQGGSFTTNDPNQGGISAASLNAPLGVVVDSANNLYIADGWNNRVLEYDTPLTGDTTADRVFGQKGAFNTQTSNKGGLSADSLYAPNGLALDAANNLYVADAGNHRVLAYLAPLTKDTTADLVLGQHGNFTANQPNNGGLTASALSNPRGVAVDTAGNVYVADTDNNRALVFLKPIAQHVYLPLIRK